MELSEIASSSSIIHDMMIGQLLSIKSSKKWPNVKEYNQDKW